jgi:hypothetical protein
MGRSGEFQKGHGMAELNAAGYPVMTTHMSVGALGNALTAFGSRANGLTEKVLNTRGFSKDTNQAELNADVAKNGVNQPLEVEYDHTAPEGKRFLLTEGNRRFLAAKAAGLSHVPVQITGNHITEGGRLPRAEEL